MNMRFEKRILVVDDDKVICDMLKRFLNRMGYAVTTAYDGTTAMKKVEKYKFNLLVSDLNIPVMDGFVLFEKCKDIAPDLKVIFITGDRYRYISKINKALKEGVCSCLYKPFNLDQLEKAVMSAVGNA